MRYLIIAAWDLDGKITNVNWETTEIEAQEKVNSLKVYANSAGENPYSHAFYILQQDGVNSSYYIVEGEAPNFTARLDQERLDADNLIKKFTEINTEQENRLSEYKSSQDRLNDLIRYVDLLGKRANNGGALTSEQQPVADELSKTMGWVVSVMDAAKSMKGDPPTDVTDSKHWPEPFE